MKRLLFPFLVFLVSVTAVADTEKNALIISGDNHLRQGDIEQSIFYYTQAITEDPQNVQAYLKRAKAYIYSRKLHLAMEDYNKAIQINPQEVQDYLKNKKSGWLHYNSSIWQEE